MIIMSLLSVTRRTMSPFCINRLACAYIHQKTTTPKGECNRHPLISVIQQANSLVLVFVSSSFPDNFDDPEFIAETGKENKSDEKTRNATEKAASTTEAAVCY